MATRDFRAEESPYFFPRKLRKAKTVQPKFSRKDMPLVFQAETQNPCGHKVSFIHGNGVLLHHYLSVSHVTHVQSQLIFLTTPARKIISSEFKDKETKEQRLNDLPKAT